MNWSIAWQEFCIIPIAATECLAPPLVCERVLFMDDLTFDRLTRLLANAGSRRAAVQSVLATLFGGALLDQDSDSVAAKNKRKGKGKGKGQGKSTPSGTNPNSAGQVGAASPHSRSVNESRRKKRKKGKGKGKGKGNGNGGNGGGAGAPACAGLGQVPAAGAACCDGLTPDTSGFCSPPAPSTRCLTKCSGCCNGEVCITNSSELCGANGAACEPCPCGTGLTKCPAVGCKDLENDDGFCGSCTNACTGTTNNCIEGECHCGTGNACGTNEICSSDPSNLDTCVCPPPKLQCDNRCTDCTPNEGGISTSRVSSQADPPPPPLPPSCCSDAQGQFCSCGGSCCAGSCWWEKNRFELVTNEYCCTADFGKKICSGQVNNPSGGGTVTKEACCELNADCPTCLNAPEQPGVAGAARRPRR